MKKGFKKGMMDPPMEKVRPRQFPSPCHGGRFLASWKSSQGCLALGWGEQEEKGTWPVL